MSNEHGDVLPLGLISIASYFKQRFLHHQIEIVDINFENPINKIFYSHYDLIGISSMTVQYEKATALARKVKDKSNIPIIIGGAHISTLPFSLRDCFDIGVIGEGEETFCNIVDLYEKKGKLFLSDLRDIGGVVYREDGKLNITQNMASIDPLDLVPSLDYSIIDHKYFRFKAVTYWAEFGREAILSTSRGCPYKCIFCSSTQFWGKVRYFSARRVMEEIKNLVKKYNVDHIWISDDLFTINKNRLKEIAEELSS